MDVTLFFAPFSEGAGGSRNMLRRAAALYAGLDESLLGPIEEGPQGKPFFSAHPNLYFSVTHSGSWWMCAFGPEPLGLDLQLHRSYAEPRRLSSRFFHPDEDAWLAQRQDQPFFDLWSAKESWVKYKGTGFFQDPASFSVVDQFGNFPCRPCAFLQMIPFHPDYSLCLCVSQSYHWCLRPLP